MGGPLQPLVDEIIVQENVLVPMRDGVGMATDLYLPAHNGKPLANLPTLLYRTPYNKTTSSRATGDGQWFARHGYAVVMQDCRGCFESGGNVNFLLPEAEDGYDTLNWIADQPWSNGQVGTWGTSWSGWTQTAMASLGPSQLGAMIPNMSGSNAHSSTVRHGGAMELRFIAWAFWHSAGNTQAQLKSEPHIDSALNLGANSFSQWLQRMPIRRGQTQLRLVPAYENWAIELLTHSDYDDYWRHPSWAPSEHWDRFPDVPMLLVGGWYDSYTRATFENFVGLSSRKKGPVKVLVGPWVHGHVTVEKSFAGDVEFGPNAALANFRDLHLGWFDAALKGHGSAIEDQPMVRLFVMGGGGGHRSNDGRLFHGGQWRDENEWPLARTHFTPYYLHHDQVLRPQPVQEHTASITYRFDPSNPVPSIGGGVSSLQAMGPMPRGLADPGVLTFGARADPIMEPGGFDQTEAPQFYGCKPPYLPLGSRSDIVVFHSEVLEQDVEVTGPITVTLWVSSTAIDTDFTAKLIDEYPPSATYPMGYALNLTDSIMRLRYRHGPQSVQFLPPGQIDQLTITLYPTSNLFVAGHRIRLDISSSNFPRFDVNPNTGEAMGLHRCQTSADNTIHLDAEHPSHIVLPIVPR